MIDIGWVRRHVRNVAILKWCNNNVRLLVVFIMPMNNSKLLLNVVKIRDKEDQEL